MKSKIDFHFDKPEDNSGYLLWQVSMKWQRDMNKSLQKVSITHTQFVVLAALGWLSKQQELVTQIEIATHSNIDRMMVSKILKTLIQKRFIERKEHPTDTRAKIVLLSEFGINTLQKALKIVQKTDNDFFKIIQPKSKIFNKQLQLILNS